MGALLLFLFCAFAGMTGSWIVPSHVKYGPVCRIQYFRYHLCGKRSRGSSQSSTHLFANTQKRHSSSSIHKRGNWKKTGDRQPNSFISYANNQQKEIRKQRATRILRDELTDIICLGEFDSMGIVDEEALTHVVISSIEMNNDMSIANVYLSIGGNAVQRRRIFVWLCKHLGQIRHALHQRMRNFKRVPLVNLNLVDTVSEEYLDSVLDEIATSNARSADANAGSMFKDVDFEEVFDENVENDDDLEDLNIDESMDYDEQDDYS